MTHRNAEPTLTGHPKRKRRPAGMLTLSILLAVVASGLSGCIVVPWGYGHEREHGYYRHGYYQGDRGYYRGDRYYHFAG